MICKDHHHRPYEFRRWALRVWEAQDHDGVSGALARACLVLLARDWDDCPLDFSVETHMYPAFYCGPKDEQWTKMLHVVARHAIVDPKEVAGKDAPVKLLDLSQYEEEKVDKGTDVSSVFARMRNQVREQQQQAPPTNNRPRVRLAQVDGKRVNKVIHKHREALKGDGWLARLFRRVGDL